ncbi:XRE family transcriptional regulator [Pseudolysobacter antarcticus]|uniref:XRE family transcriptional regulator n=1 Tax=Pseudolysobacter antarcticus TaxID=2511995 RepID=A0A411HFW4_9GAMM|nr:helix-turn-helix transcriptional regulator [Pseudolysobacter antarcticus]QBB69350.1 XRE family transcriptional regulator [Pseudolysobacter antarcticus]
MRKTGKSIHRSEFKVAIRCLVEIREKAGITQMDLAAKIKRTQTFVSAAERGIRRVDIVQLRDITHACGTDLVAFSRMLEEGIARMSAPVAAAKNPPRKGTR